MELNLDFITQKELAKLLDVSEPTLIKYVQTGKLPKPVRLGRENKWPKHLIQDWFEKARY